MHDPFDVCECGHSRRSHYRSYDDGSGQGGCNAWLSLAMHTCRCEKFAPYFNAVSPVATGAPSETLDGKTIGEWRAIAMAARQEARRLSERIDDLADALKRASVAEGKLAALRPLAPKEFADRVCAFVATLGPVQAQEK